LNPLITTAELAGHPGVRVLDGGLRAWIAEGLPVSTEESRPEPGDFEARPGGMPLLDPSRPVATG